MVLPPRSPRFHRRIVLTALLVACADPPPVTEFQVQLVAEGTGTVSGAAGVLDCTLPAHSGTCAFELESGTEGVTVTATPAPGFLFTGWRSLGVHAPDGAVAACAGSDDPVCELPTETGPVMLRPRFEYPGIVEVAIVGEGTVRSTTHSCGEEALDQERCRRSFPSGTAVTLKASGDGFGGWDAPCYEVSTTCVVEVSSAVTMTAYFQQAAPVTTHVLRVLPAGGGTGRVRSSDDNGARIDCVIGGGAAVGRCAARTAIGAVVPVAVTADVGSIAYAVSPGECGDGECSLTLDQDRVLLARFEPPVAFLTVTGAPADGVGRIISEPAGLDCPIGGSSTFTCGPVAFPFGTEVRVRVTAAGHQPTVASNWWRPCPTGNGFCVDLPMLLDQRLTINLMAKRQTLTLIKEGDVPGGNVVLGFEPEGQGISTVWEFDASYANYEADTASFVTAQMRLPDSLEFLGWQGACTGTGLCEFGLHGDKELRFRVGRRP